jgi:hypothetical protein
MRLVSCVGLLMIIPAIALLTHSNEPQVNKLGAVKAHGQDSVGSITPKHTSHVDSVQLTKTDLLPAQNQLNFTAKSAVKSTSVLTDSK